MSTFGWGLYMRWASKWDFMFLEDQGTDGYAGVTSVKYMTLVVHSLIGLYDKYV